MSDMCVRHNTGKLLLVEDGALNWFCQLQSIFKFQQDVIVSLLFVIRLKMNISLLMLYQAEG